MRILQRLSAYALVWTVTVIFVLISVRLPQLIKDCGGIAPMFMIEPKTQWMHHIFFLLFSWNTLRWLFPAGLLVGLMHLGTLRLIAKCRPRWSPVWVSLILGAVPAAAFGWRLADPLDIEIRSVSSGVFLLGSLLCACIAAGNFFPVSLKRQAS